MATRELLSVQSQLDSMGGGDTRIAPLSIIVRVRPPKGPNSGLSSILVDGESVFLIDPRAADSIPLEKAQRIFKVTQTLPPESSQDEAYAAVGQSSLDYMWDGFNAAGTFTWFLALYFVKLTSAPGSDRRGPNREWQDAFPVRRRRIAAIVRGPL